MLQNLINIYNTMCLVETKGQSTVYMAACISTLKDLIEEESLHQNETKENE